MNSEELGKKLIEALSAGNNAKMNYKQIAGKIGIFDKNGREHVKRVIDNFVEAKVILTAGRGKYRLNPKYLTAQNTGKNYIIGRLEMKHNGMAFVIPQNEKDDTPTESKAEDIFVADGNLGNALHNDTVKVVLFPARHGKRPEGQVVEVVERSKKQLVGTIQIRKGVAYFIPDNVYFRRDVIIPGRLLKNAKSGDKVVVVIVD